MTFIYRLNLLLIMAKHHPDLIFCRKQPGVAIGRLCEKCDGRCVICDSYVRPCTLVRICDECNYGSYQVQWDLNNEHMNNEKTFELQTFRSLVVV